MIVDPDFLDHWKTRTLVALLDNDEMAPMYVIRLWGHCQTRRQCEFPNLSPTALKGICRFAGDSDLLDRALAETGFIARKGDVLTVVGWDEYNATLITAWTNGKRGGRHRKAEKNPPVNQRDTQPVYPPDTPQAARGQPDKIRLDGIGLDESKKPPVSPPEGDTTTKRFRKPTIEEVQAYCTERRNSVNPQRFMNHYESNGWRVGKSAMKDWKAAIRNWEGSDGRTGTNVRGNGGVPSSPTRPDAAGLLAQLAAEEAKAAGNAGSGPEPDSGGAT